MVLRVGLTHATDLCLTGRMIDGKEAERIGLINRAVPIDQLEDEVNRYAEGFAKFRGTASPWGGLPNRPSAMPWALPPA